MATGKKISQYTPRLSKEIAPQGGKPSNMNNEGVRKRKRERERERGILKENKNHLNRGPERTKDYYCRLPKAKLAFRSLICFQEVSLLRSSNVLLPGSVYTSVTQISITRHTTPTSLFISFLCSCFYTSSKVKIILVFFLKAQQKVILSLHCSHSLHLGPSCQHRPLYGC